MKTKEEIERAIKDFERVIERNYNIGTPLAQSTATNFQYYVDALVWVLDEEGQGE